ncbi:aspartyl protease family protein [Chryseobacterium luquanense]|uniref:Aspartyl protease family protein n=1 Tax=Chryseobacterium luquanense TaxID=2983766 RepID=A0ABT3XYD7_9FLAO|nr:aspartyl protease family protein [Chryseobacterium luquanense]MCX8530883.1 aspartyl protease family protein [Chryseobacterium luquanense]
MRRSIFTYSICLVFILLSFKTIAQIPFEVNSNGHIIIKAKINNVEGKFILDTGAGLNAIFTKFSNKIKNEKTPNFFVGHRATGEELNVDLYNAKSMEINDKVFSDQQYTIVDLEFGDIDGMISLQPFRNTPITIDYNNKKILFDRPTKGEKSVDIQIADYAGKAIDIFTFVELNDTLKIQSLLDSGAGKNSFWFSSKLMEALALNKSDFKAVPIKSDFKKENNYYIGKLSTISTLNKLRKVENLDAAFIDELIYEGKTSIDWLGHVLTIDIAKKKIFIAD